jgi:predicted GH43/DUF377 family glycosyl hydrolase
MIVERLAENPVLGPNSVQSWEAEAVFNGCPVIAGNRTYLIYRGMSFPHYHTSVRKKISISNIGIAYSRDGVHFQHRRRLIVPEYDWEKFGCEDPRVTKLNDKYYIFYTALSDYPFHADCIKVGVAISNDLSNITAKHLVTPFNAKGMALFPEKIKGKMCALLTVNTDRPPAKICLASFDDEEDMWSAKHWEVWYGEVERYVLPLQRKPEDHVEVGAPPIKTDDGWLVLYSYIQNYFSSERLFTVEAALLDANDPLKIIARTSVPILTAEEYYERMGLVPKVVFPSGARVKDGWIWLYYGAADTTCCIARIRLSSLVKQMVARDKRAQLVRAKENPILTPNNQRPWESKATFNPAALYLDGKVHLLYRAMSDGNTSTVGYAVSNDGIHITDRLSQPVYVPREPFEQELQPGGNSGCEDPRLTIIGDMIYMTYTAFDGNNPPRVALTCIKVDDFLHQHWQWSKPMAISPPDVDDKDAFIFPEKVNGKYMIVHRIGVHINYAFSRTLDFSRGNWLDEYRWIAPRKGWWDSKKIGAAAPPVKTKDGWVFLYHGVSDDDNGYRVGAVLLDKLNPVTILGRTDDPILEPRMSYEKEGQIPNVVFPCGNVLMGEKLFVYYGGGDSTVNVATIAIDELLRVLK